MLDEESHERDDELDTDELIKKELVEHPEVLEVIEERKKRKFTWSGLAVMVVGAALIVFGLTLHTGVNSLEGVLVAACGGLRVNCIFNEFIGRVRRHATMPKLVADVE